MNNFITSVAEARKQLEKEKGPVFTVVMRDKKMSVELFAPRLIDSQSPHLQDELYVIISGESDFYRNGDTVHCATGDVLFVPAGMEHRFVNFTEDFSTWVIFYGDEV